VVGMLIQVQGIPEDDAVQKSRMKSFADLIGSNLEPPAVIIEDVLSVGVNLLFARQNKGKTWMALQITDSVTSGRSFLGRNVVKTGRVLFYCLEDGERNLKQRLGLQWASDSNPQNALYSDDLNTANLGGFEELEREIQVHRPVLVVIDNLLAFLGHGVIDTNRASLMSQYMMRFRKLVRDHDVAFLLVHHGKKPTKDVSEEGPENALGSTALSALCDTRMQIHSPDREPILETWSKVFRNQRIPMAFDRERFLWRKRHHDGE